MKSHVPFLYFAPGCDDPHGTVHHVKSALAAENRIFKDSSRFIIPTEKNSRFSCRDGNADYCYGYCQDGPASCSQDRAAKSELKVLWEDLKKYISIY